MNQVTDTMLNHVTHRIFDKNFEIDDRTIQTIIDCLKKAPTHINGQFYSVIVVRDLKKRKRLVELNPLNGHILKSSVFLLFIADFNRSRIIMESNDTQHDFGKNIDNLFVAGIDAGLAAMNAVNTIESLELGCVIVGGVRYHAKETIQLFNLPKFTYPLFGLSIGKPLDNPTKSPRLPKALNVFEENYNTIPSDFFNDYDQLLIDSRVTQGSIWSESIFNYFENDTLKTVTKENLEAQGLLS
ncbi:nitroreductase family protein [Enterococcus sp. AZ072]|uniref:nitroreductase family protein n=1 Tax=unclassified Enterococcus TaxID=2608891 RepID=UPI003D2B920D